MVSWFSKNKSTITMTVSFLKVGKPTKSVRDQILFPSAVLEQTYFKLSSWLRRVVEHLNFMLEVKMTFVVMLFGSKKMHSSNEFLIELLPKELF